MHFHPSSKAESLLGSGDAFDCGAAGLLVLLVESDA